MKQARTLAAEKNILEVPRKKEGAPLSKEIDMLVKDFYCDDKFSRAMPGSKDVASIRRNVHVQKQLILCTLKGLFSEFRKQCPDTTIGFSRFVP